MIVLKLHSAPVKYTVISIHFLMVNYLLGVGLDLGRWLPLTVVLALIVEYL